MTARCPCGCEDHRDPTTGIYELCELAERRDELAADELSLQDRAIMSDQDNFLMGLITSLRGLAEQAAEHGVTLSADIQSGVLAGSSFDGLAAWADEVRSVVNVGPEFRVAKWRAVPVSLGVAASEVTLYEPTERRAA